MKLHDFFDFHARENPKGEFAVCEGRSLTYRQAYHLSNQIANALIDKQPGPSSRVALLSKNSLIYPLLYLAASKAGAVLVPLNYRLAPSEWSYIIGDAQARLLLVSPEFLEGATQIRDALGSEGNVVVLDMEGSKYRFPALNDWLAESSKEAPGLPLRPQDPAYQMYTSGTTGRPKGAIIPHSSVVSNVVQLGAIMQGTRGARYLLVAPLYHAAAGITAFTTLSWGGSLFIQSDFDPQAVVGAMSQERIFGALLIPAMIQACLVKVRDVAERSYPELKVITYGASPVAEQTLRGAASAFKCDFVQGYGLTESTAVLTCLTKRDHRLALEERPELLISAGRPVLGTRIRIIDEEGQPLPPGEIGEIVARGPQVMAGYWNRPEATRRAMAGNWLHTGDAGKLDEDGYLFIMDRVKDMIVSGGENVYPRAVEEVLYQHPAITEAAVIGVPDEEWGEAVKAVVVIKEGEALSEGDVVNFCKSRIARFQCPRSVDFIEELPRNPSGKVLKRELREPYWKGHQRRV